MRWLRTGRKNKSESSDEELLQAYCDHQDKESIELLFDRYVHLVYGVCLKYLKERDIAQDATMQLFEKLMDILQNQQINSFQSWLYSTTKNHCLMILRKKGIETIEYDKVAFMESAEDLHPIDNENEENLDKLQQCIETLKVDQKECIELFYLKKNSYDQIVNRTGYDLKKVKSHLQNGRRNLKICMESNVSKIRS